MGFFKISKKKIYTMKNDNYILFSEWIDKILEKGLPDTIIALNFNLYEGTEQTYDIQLIGSDEFDKDDSDWACSELFTTGEDICYIPRTDDIIKWEDGLFAIKEIIYKYLQEGKNSDYLKKFKAIAVGFIDGDLEILSMAK